MKWNRSSMRTNSLAHNWNKPWLIFVFYDAQQNLPLFKRLLINQISIVPGSYKYQHMQWIHLLSKCYNQNHSFSRLKCACNRCVRVDLNKGKIYTMNNIRFSFDSYIPMWYVELLFHMEKQPYVCLKAGL